MKFPLFAPLLILPLFSSIPVSKAGFSGSLEIKVLGLHSSAGSVIVCLFVKEAGFPDMKNAYKVSSSGIVDKTATIHFDELPPGEYAISAFHDENNNKNLDRNFFGIPKEGVGASNDAKGHFGPPKYRDARFTLDQGSKTMLIHITYL